MKLFVWLKVQYWRKGKCLSPSRSFHLALLDEERWARCYRYFQRSMTSPLLWVQQDEIRKGPKLWNEVNPNSSPNSE